jgi:hypothetical protein
VLLFPQLSIPGAGPQVNPSDIQIELPPIGGEDNGLPPLDLGPPPDLGGGQQQQL